MQPNGVLITARQRGETLALLVGGLFLLASLAEILAPISQYTADLICRGVTDDAPVSGFAPCHAGITREQAFSLAAPDLRGEFAPGSVSAFACVSAIGGVVGSLWRKAATGFVKAWAPP
ncbi:hypothetical protein JCM17844_15320 [Iodidimonas gelatinilytica]|uniref:Uncharacterized protein n=1 Tax=Iodidimonas gelatinilytica TaxID=1236966 RepID=A0A5A7MSE6_9PROT|nr:hypothetical protein [Iodidimonas gelatinilytica]GEQ97895.1 hypothetical protein JCM17844_15320 [Iodidimonas gelatinilytica]GEQ99981.1 hypothetical protein JCM17845_06050 [Iodidimonas gelatinilytica]